MRYLPFLLLMAAGVLGQASACAQTETDSTDYVSEQPEKPAPTPPRTDKPPIKDKIYFGGFFGVSFGTVTSISVEPLVGWKWTPKLSSGLVLSYWYLRDNRYEPSFESSSIGYRIFSRYRVIPQAYLHAEWAQFFYDDIIDPETLVRGPGNVPYLFVGGGVSQPMGRNATFFIQVLYDVIQDPRSVYRSNNDIYVSMGIVAGF